ncbi:uncharacterized protein LOC119680536 isoform X2 [Teleopsis dalmanni]|uniref:uncharacterized protein LOC119680536 isoform X2 n=1 Tax=Teleopsis dalmanni TaxID=139649 RepID=UPI0018CFA10E|nr:uncharacterized protein LOC119680536 isoform X2 [Teleopsis dalmanni]
MPHNRLCSTQATRSYPNYNKQQNVQSGTSSGVMEPLNSIRERYQRGSQHIHNKVRSDLKQSMEKERNNVL